MQYLQLLQFIIKEQSKHDPVFKIMRKNGSSILVVYNKFSKTYE